MESTKTKILKALRETTGYLSGQELCTRLGVSRTAVWKCIKQLEGEGYLIDAVPNRGYCLKDTPDILNESEIRSRLKTSVMGCSVEYLEQVDSTNTQAKRLAEEGAPSGTLVVADVQTRGKGRRGREWKFAQGGSIFMTLLLRPELAPEKASMLTLLMGLSVVQGIRNITGVQTQIKWPNDVVLNHKKMVGILTEMNAQIDYIEYVVIGTGINVNQTEFPKDLQDMATSLRIELGKPFNRAEIIAEVMERFEENYEQFCKTQDLSVLAETYNQVLVNKDQQVKVLETGREYEGTARGIDEQGRLLVERPDGSVERVFAGEVSVRGLYGYA